MRKIFLIVILSIVTIGAIASGYILWNRPSLPQTNPAITQFRGDQAWEDVAYQVSLGPRIPGSQAHQNTVNWIESELQQAGWDVELQSTESGGHPIKNIVGKWGTGSPWIILGAHYDSRIFADHDPDPNKQNQPVPGANDGASGVAVLLEIARVLPNVDAISGANRNPGQSVGQVWVVFFDAEDNGRIADWDWIMGSRAFVDSLSDKPDAAVIVDMIGDSDLQIYLENNSDPELSRQIWDIGQKLGYDQFISEPKYTILDDHIPFLEAGIPAADLIDFDYPYYHTTEDTADKVSPESLEAVGNTLIHWLTRPSP
jgi:glutaminyl-peptide cyclotransferase